MTDGQQIDRFRTVPARDTEFHMRELHTRLDGALNGPHTDYHPVLVIGVYVLDLLVIHPFDDGNGRTARLATTALLHHGFGVARYVSIDSLIDRTSDDYYRALQASTEGWHEGRHDPWPWLRYLVARVREAYTELDRLVAEYTPAGTKAERVRDYILRTGPAAFAKDDIRAHLPDISDATIQRALADIRDDTVLTRNRPAAQPGPGHPRAPDRISSFSDA